MTPRKKLEALEQRERIFETYHYLCSVCGYPVKQYGTAQLAHRLSKSQMNIKKYGESVIQHYLNLAPVCSLKCNDAVNIGYRTAEAEELADKIRDELLKE
jgi:hypothetical protein